MEKMVLLHNARLRILFKSHWRACAVKVRIDCISARTSLLPEFDLPTSLFTRDGELIIKRKQNNAFSKKTLEDAEEDVATSRVFAWKTLIHDFEQKKI